MDIPILKQGDSSSSASRERPPTATCRTSRTSSRNASATTVRKGVIIDVTALDVMDSFAARMLRDTAHTLRLRGAETVLCGIQPDAAFTMVRLGMTLEGVETVLDLEEGLEFLQARARERRDRG